MDSQSYQIQYIDQVELEQKIAFKELPVIRSEFHQHFEAGASMWGIYQQVRGEEVKAGNVVCSCRRLERQVFRTS